MASIISRQNAVDDSSLDQTEGAEVPALVSGGEPLLDEVETIERRSESKRLGRVPRLGIGAVTAAILLALLGAVLILRPKSLKHHEVQLLKEDFRTKENYLAHAHTKASTAIDHLLNEKGTYSIMMEMNKVSDDKDYRRLLSGAAQEAKVAVVIQLGLLEDLAEAFSAAAPYMVEPDPVDQHDAKNRLAILLAEAPKLFKTVEELLDSEWQAIDAVKREYDNLPPTSMTIEEAKTKAGDASEKLTQEFVKLKPTIDSLGFTSFFSSIESLANGSRIVV